MTVKTPFQVGGSLLRSQSKPKEPKEPKAFETEGKLFMIVSTKGKITCFRTADGIMPPEQINKILERMGLNVRVNEHGQALSTED